MKLKNSAMLKQGWLVFPWLPHKQAYIHEHPNTLIWVGTMIFGKQFYILFLSSHSKQLQAGS